MSINKDILQIQDQINSIIGINTTVTRRKKNNEDIKHELFVNIITQIELAINRSTLSDAEFGINLTEYDEVFFSIIDNLIFLSFGTKAGMLISSYCYDRLDNDGCIVYTNDKGQEIEISDPEKLWNEVKKLI
jgi:hypothetical protein